MYLKNSPFKGILLIHILLLPFIGVAQAVTGIITDLNGWWKSTSSSINPIKPANSHNLLAFSYNGTQYSTGVNNDLLSSQGESFRPCDFWSLPVASISGNINGNTKIGLGALYDGVANGSSNPAPENNIPLYLTDGTKGLNIGTCVANLPTGTLDFFASSIDANSIGDGVPDILVTQVADPSSGSFDRYEFIDNNGVRVGNYKDIVFTSIAPVGTWTADFYEASQNPMNLAGGFTQTDRPMRLWAADLSEFGLTASNIGTVSKFRINLCGNSDVAFVAYNSQSFRVATVLPVSIASFKGSVVNNQPKLNWETKTQSDRSQIQIERSKDGRSFEMIGVENLNSNLPATYSFIDQSAVTGTYYYRLKMIDEKGKVQYSTIIQLSLTSSANFKAFKSGANSISVYHRAPSNERISIYHTSGRKLVDMEIETGATQTTIPVQGLSTGIYIVVLEGGKERLATKVFVD